jgi:hypothetical protein
MFEVLHVVLDYTQQGMREHVVPVQEPHAPRLSGIARLRVLTRHDLQSARAVDPIGQAHVHLLGLFTSQELEDADARAGR